MVHVEYFLTKINQNHPLDEKQKHVLFLDCKLPHSLLTIVLLNSQHLPPSHALFHQLSSSSEITKNVLRNKKMKSLNLGAE